MVKKYMSENQPHDSEKAFTIRVTTSTLKLVAVLVIGLVAGYVAGAGFSGETSAKAELRQAANPGNEGAPATPPERVSVSTDDDASLGPKNADVTVIEFSDFECPFCSRAYPAVKQMLKEYEGKIRFVYRDFPLSFHPNAQKAAEAAECAKEQGKFWEMHDKIFENQQAIGIADLKKHAKEFGLDSAKFDRCLDSGKYASEVQKDFADGQAAGVSGTPTFFIGNDKDGYVMLVGAQPYSVFKQVLDAELA